MAVQYSQTVTENEEGTFDGVCSGKVGKAQREMCGFTSSNWPTEELALKRMAEHADEHVDKKPMRELVDFMVEEGVTL